MISHAKIHSKKYAVVMIVHEVIYLYIIDVCIYDLNEEYKMRALRSVC